MTQYIYGAIALAFVGAASWVFFVYGPAQYKAGEQAVELRLTTATDIAQKEASTDAEKFRISRLACYTRGLQFNFASGECIEE